MQEITLTINGQSVKGKTGDTVLAICRANGIDVPTLCHLEGLNDVGACRLCVVEIQSEKKPIPACNYPARDGLVIKTSTPQLERYRKQVIELLFAERNHFCMFCESSGDCELQKMAYRKSRATLSPTRTGRLTRPKSPASLTFTREMVTTRTAPPWTASRRARRHHGRIPQRGLQQKQQD